MVKGIDCLPDTDEVQIIYDAKRNSHVRYLERNINPNVEAYLCQNVNSPKFDSSTVPIDRIFIKL